MTPTEATAIASAVQERIAELLRYRRWYHRNPRARGEGWDEMRRADRVELRALIRLVKAARKAPARTAYPVGASYHDVQAGRVA